MRKKWTLFVLIFSFLPFFVFCQNPVQRHLDVYLLLDLSNKMTDENCRQLAYKTVKKIYEKLYFNKERNTNDRFSIYILGKNAQNIFRSNIFHMGEINSILEDLELLYKPDNASWEKGRNLLKINQDLDKDIIDFSEYLSKMANTIDSYHGNPENSGEKNFVIVLISGGIQDVEGNYNTSGDAPEGIENSEIISSSLKRLLTYNSEPRINCHLFFFHHGSNYREFWKEQCSLTGGKYYAPESEGLLDDQINEMFVTIRRRDYNIFKISKPTVDAPIADVYKFEIEVDSNLREEGTFYIKVSEKRQKDVFLGVSPSFLMFPINNAPNEIVLNILIKKDIPLGTYYPQIEFIPTDSEEIDDIYIINTPPINIFPDKTISNDIIKFYTLEEPVILNPPGKGFTTDFDITFDTQIGGDNETSLKALFRQYNEFPAIIAPRNKEFDIKAQGVSELTIEVENNLAEKGMNIGYLTFEDMSGNQYEFWNAKYKNEKDPNKKVLIVKFYNPDYIYVISRYLWYICGFCILIFFFRWIFMNAFSGEKHNITDLFKKEFSVYKWYDINVTDETLRIGNQCGDIGLPINDLSKEIFLEIKKNESNFTVKRIKDSLDRITKSSKNISKDLEYGSEEEVSNDDEIIINDKIVLKFICKEDLKKIRISFKKIPSSSPLKLEITPSSSCINLPEIKSLGALVLFFLILIWAVTTVLTFWLPGIPFKGWNAFWLVISILMATVIIYKIMPYTSKKRRENSSAEANKWIDIAPYIPIITNIILDIII